MVSISTDELAESGAERVVDSPNEQTHAHVDPMYDQLLNRRQRRNVAQSLVIAANRKVPAYIPATPSPPTPIRASSEIASYIDTTVQSGTKSIFRVHALKNNGVMSELTNPAEITVP